MVEDEEIGTDLDCLDDQIGELPFSQDKFRIEGVTVLDDGVEDFHPRCTGQFLQFFEGLCTVRKGVRFHPDQYGAIRRRDSACLLAAGQFFFQCLDEVGKVEIDFRRPDRLHEEPVVTLRIFGNKVCRVNFSRESLIIHFDGRDEIEAEQRQVGKVIPGQRFPVQVGVEKAESLESG